MQTIARTADVEVRADLKLRTAETLEGSDVAALERAPLPERTDTVGIALSLLCMLHCAIFLLSPIFLPFAAAQEHVHGQSHLWFAVAVSLVSVLAFGRGYCSHRSLEVLSRAGLGLGLLFLGLLLEESSLVLSVLLTVLGSVLLVATHFLNRRLKAVSCSCCH